MKIVCVTKTDGLTVGKDYDVLSTGPKPGSKWTTIGYNIINDFGEEVWHEECPMGIIEVLSYTGEIVEYIGKPCDGITEGKSYYILNRDSRDSQSGSYYFMNDKNEFVGISKRNYFGGAYNFTTAKTVLRDKVINDLLK